MMLHAASIPADDSRQSQFLDHRADAAWDLTAPIGEPVEVDFTTDQGTWMSVDISPDGRWLVFDLLGHVYRVDAGGGQAVCLTQDSRIALNFHPRISPDGSAIAFVSDRGGQNNLWVMNADGSNPVIVFEDAVSRITSPTWMPDGNAIVSVREFPTYSMHRRSARIWTFPLGQPSRVPEELVGHASGLQSYWPSVSPDGRFLYYMQSTFAEPLHGMQRYQHVRRVELATGNVAVLTVPEGKEFYKAEGPTELAPEVSPDGRWLAFARRIDGGFLQYRGHSLRGRTALWVRNLDTGEERILADPITYDMQNAHGMKNLRVLPGYAWDAQSRSVVFSQGGRIRRAWLDSGQVDTIPFTARVRRTASRQARSTHDIDDGPFESKYIRWPDVSPDGEAAVFESAGWIWRMDLPRGRVERLTGGRESENPDGQRQFMPAISPDGKQVVYASWDDHELGQLWRVSVEGGRPKPLTRRAARYLFPTWAPDGSAIVVLRSKGASAESIAGGGIVANDLVSIQLRSGEESVLIEDAPPLKPHAGPDGRWFQLEQRGQVDVQPFLARGQTPPDSHAIMVSFAPDDVSRRPHLRFPAASEAAPSPDGQWVAYREEHEIHLTALNRAGSVYHPDRPLVWSGPATPTEVVKENPLHGVTRLSDGGGVYLRWIDAHRLVYAAAGRIHLFDARSGEASVFEPRLMIDRQIPQGTLALTGARVIPLGGGQVLENATLLITGSRIACVGRCDTGSADRVIAIDGATVIPGFVDVHAHGYYFGERHVIGELLPPTSMFLAHGVTTGLDPSANSSGVFPVAELVNAGRLPGPRTFTTGEALQPQAPLTGPATFEDAERMVRRLADQGAISIKIYLTPRRDQRQMLVEAARRHGLSATNEGADVTYNVGSMLDGDTGFEHPMHQMPTWGDVARFFAATKAVYSPTLTVAGATTWMEDYFQSRADLWNDARVRRFLPWRRLTRLVNHTTRPKTEYAFPAMAETVADIIRAGGYGAIGGHGQTFGLDSHWEVWGYAEALTPMEALEMASLGGARMAGLEDDLGSIEVGKLADLMVLDANPLDDIRHTADIRYVMKGGVLYDDETLDELWPSAVARPLPAWVREDVFRSDSREISE
jgi:Tol biopolymer transport system component